MRKLMIYSIFILTCSGQVLSQDIFKTLDYEAYTLTPVEEMAYLDSSGRYEAVPLTAFQLLLNIPDLDTLGNLEFKAGWSLFKSKKHVFGMGGGYEQDKDVSRVWMTYKAIAWSKYIVSGTFATATKRLGDQTHNGISASVSRSHLLDEIHLIKWHFGAALGKALAQSNKDIDSKLRLIYQLNNSIFSRSSMEIIAKLPTAFQGIDDLQMSINPAISVKLFGNFMLRLATGIPIILSLGEERTIGFSATISK